MACGVCGVLRVSFGAAVGVAVIVGEHREWTVYRNHNKSQKKPAKPAVLWNFLKTHSFHRRTSFVKKAPKNTQPTPPSFETSTKRTALIGGFLRTKPRKTPQKPADVFFSVVLTP